MGPPPGPGERRRLISERYRLESGGPAETRAVGERLGRLLDAGDVVLLQGELGAGKTTFVQGVARGLGFEGAVSSKSFVLLGEYQGRVKLYHADLYRLEDPEEVLDLGLEEIAAAGVLVVEWPERAGGWLQSDHLLVLFEVEGEDRRIIEFEATGDRPSRVLEALPAA